MKIDRLAMEAEYARLRVRLAQAGPLSVKAMSRTGDPVPGDLLSVDSQGPRENRLVGIIQGAIRSDESGH